MKSMLLLALGAPLLCACATNAPATSWGKEGVSMLDYRLDGAQCAVMASTQQGGGNQANTAGGITGKNGGESQLPSVNPNASANASFPTGGGGPYRDSAPPDVVNRAAMAHRAREIEEQRLRTEALKGCLVERGYREFALTAEQRKHLATLPEGSEARREYLYKLGTDPQVLAGARKTGS